MKAGTAESEKTSIARQRYGKHFSAITNNDTKEELLKVMFSTRSVLRLYRENQLESRMWYYGATYVASTYKDPSLPILKQVRV
jgi:hypothetical protein